MPSVTKSVEQFINHGWSDELWADENDYILSMSLVATSKTLKRRRRIIETEREGKTFPLHLMHSRREVIVYQADETRKPEKWFAVGARESRPLAWLTSRAWSEWFWFRGRSVQTARTKIPTNIAAQVVERDWPTCQICFGDIGLGEQHLDHITPWSLGGEHEVSNLRLTHDLCNIRRGIGGNDG